MPADLASGYGREPLYWEAAELLRYTPQTPDTDLSNYIHHYEHADFPGQLLSTQMRELIATLGLVVMGHHRFAARHVRRLYRLGVPPQVVIDAFWAASPFIGRAHVLTGVRTVHWANDASNLEGTLPADGPPTELTDFAELHLGNTAGGRRMLEGTPEWQLIADIDPRLAELGLGVYERLLDDAATSTLPVGARELIAIVACAWRGLVDDAAEHIKIAYACGVTPRHVVEALSAAMPMTGVITLQVGARALLRAQADAANSAREAVSAP
jgi:alkylhydroperoxidase/carboxymuconolactone decarboxylase family protein YurZ